MKSRPFLATSVLLLASAFVIAQDKWAPEDVPSLQNSSESPPHGNLARQYSYAIGLEIGSSFRTDELHLDTDRLMAGLLDGIQGKEAELDNQTCGLAMQKLSEIRMKSMIARNQKFLEENGKAEGVKTLPSGLQYKVLQSGDGATPTAEDVVKTHYRGKLIDGTEFDSSFARNEPAIFPVGGVIPGWTEALQLMKVGDKWELVIPSDLAYGDAGAGGVIQPHATLVFEIELLGIESR